ncbi:MAG: RNA polymerase sigma factor [Planctomycetota bacterium]
MTTEPSPLPQVSTDFGVRLVGELPRLRRHLAARVVGRARLDDLVQETVLRALQSADSFDEKRALWPWIRTIAERSGRSSGRPEHEEPLVTEPAATESRSVAASEELRVLLARLPLPERSVVERYYVHGESIGEISSALHLAQGTVQSRLWRARRRLAVIAAALAPATWLILRGSAGLPESAPAPATFEALSLETKRLATPTFPAIEPDGNEPLRWSLEGAAWFEDDLPDKGD